ncbi:MAG: tetratricopeptide repeat protein [Anaerolineales bacterium]|nr:tetratricopeptide repeat protein [Anaerolineales bacterium]MCS7247140.1 tetratricopeptide repeat protein [Anaerolineales bacterium]MDW8160951.1 tetratricopeptide repeat protein [Anaerolineales bacterium]MDW8446697.1 tetratricopeptide repeat protein [Anaerolineales bacterium]
MSDHILDVNELDFHYNVLEYSFQHPVVIDFWAEWCHPCKMLTPILEKIAIEADGAFRLAKINIDKNSNLAIRMGVHSIPHVKGVRNGKVVGEFVGLQPEAKVREFIQKLIPHPSELWIEKGNHLYQQGDWEGAAEAFRQALQINNDNTTARLGLAKSLFRLQALQEALSWLEDFPTSREYPEAERLRYLITETLQATRAGTPEDELEAAYQNSLRLLYRQNYLAALDGLLDVLRQNKSFHNGKLKEIIVEILDLLGDAEPETRSYRQELASILW